MNDKSLSCYIVASFRPPAERRSSDSTIQRFNDSTFPFDPFSYQRRPTPEIELQPGVKCGGEQTVRVVVTRATFDKVAPKIRLKDDVKPEAVYEDLNVLEVDPLDDFNVNGSTQLVTVKDGVAHCTCNGEVLEAALELPASGPIGVEGDRGQMEYRRIRIKDLSR